MEMQDLMLSLCSGFLGSAIAIVFTYNTAKIKIRRETAVEIIEHLESLEDAKNQILNSSNYETIGSASDSINYLLWKKTPLLKAEIVFGEETKNDIAEILKKFKEYTDKVSNAAKRRLQNYLDFPVELFSASDKTFDEIDSMLTTLISKLKRKCSLNFFEQIGCPTFSKWWEFLNISYQK